MKFRNRLKKGQVCDFKVCQDQAKSVLVVSADHFEQMHLLNILSDYEFDVELSGTLIDGVSKYKPGKHSVVITDVFFTDLNKPNEGIDLIKSIRMFSKLEEQPLIISLGDDLKFEIESIEAGSDYFFKTPLCLENLQQVLYHQGILVERRA